MTLGNRLKNERKRLGKTQAAFAKLAGARENGATILTDDQFMALIETGELPIEND